MPPPGQRLGADAQAPPGRALRHLAEIAGRAGSVVERGGLGVAAHQDKLGAERLHDVELPLGAVQAAGAPLVRHRLEVAEGLEEQDREAEPVGDPPHLRGRAFEGEQVALEDLHPVEADRRRLQLLRQRAAEADRGDRFGKTWLRENGAALHHGPRPAQSAGGSNRWERP